MWDHILNFSKSGIAHYFLFDIEGRIYQKEPVGAWALISAYDSKNYENIKPQLYEAGMHFGSGLGFNFLSRFELMPYFLIGCNYDYLDYKTSSSKSDDIQLINLNNGQTFLTKDSKPTRTPHGTFAVTGYAGVKLNINLWYPVQWTIGADYNYSYYPQNDRKQLMMMHYYNRLNVYVGLRFNY
jgi:hypothetical protein